MPELTSHQLESMIKSWDMQLFEEKTPVYYEIYEHLEYLNGQEWRQYLPTGPEISFMDRLATWLGNAESETEQRLLLEYTNHIGFFSHDDMDALHKTAYNRIVLQWITEMCHTKFSGSFPGVLEDDVVRFAEKETWYCPITDSLDINEFYKCNRLTGRSHRPHFRTLCSLFNGLTNDQSKQDYLNSILSLNHEGFTYLVLLEDFLGSGNQAQKTLNWVASTFTKKKLLFIPLVSTRQGLDLVSSVLSSHGNLSIRPIIVIDDSELLGPHRPTNGGWAISEALEAMIRRYWAHDDVSRFGYCNSGCSISFFSNTPDNTVPLLRGTNDSSWKGLFPRVKREASND